jgi:hypothetical protein
MQERTTSRVMVADRPYGEFYDVYNIILEYFGYHHIQQAWNYVLNVRLDVFIPVTVRTACEM